MRSFFLAAILAVGLLFSFSGAMADLCDDVKNRFEGMNTCEEENVEDCVSFQAFLSRRGDHCQLYAISTLPPFGAGDGRLQIYSEGSPEFWNRERTTVTTTRQNGILISSLILQSSYEDLIAYDHLGLNFVGEAKQIHFSNVRIANWERVFRNIARRNRNREEDRCAGVVCDVEGQTCAPDNGLCECPSGQEISEDGTACVAISENPLSCGGPCGEGEVCDEVLDQCVPEGAQRPAGCLESDALDCDTVADSQDNCPGDFNPDQSDTDSDMVGDICDECPLISREERLTRAPGESDSLGIWVNPALGCPAGLIPTPKSLSEVTGNNSGGAGGSCALTAQKFSAAAAGWILFGFLLLGLWGFRKCRNP